MRPSYGYLLVSQALLLLVACNLDSVERCQPDDLGVTRRTCLLPGWDDRPFTIQLPEGAGEPVPLLIAFHGGGGNAAGATSITCPDGDKSHPDCLDRMAVSRGYAFVAPNGTGTRPLRNLRTWNAGGGYDGYYCSTGGACASGVDDMAYVDDLLAELDRIAPIDGQRVYTTGLSNGASISHRLACERPSKIRAIAPLSGPNQHGESGGECSGGVAVLHMHGTEDPCAAWEDSDSTSCAGGALKGLKIGVPRTMEGWRLRNGCDAATTEDALADLDPNDGSTARRIRWQGCDADVELIRIEGGGHTWPGGDAYLGEGTIGSLNRDFLASELVLDFFDANP